MDKRYQVFISSTFLDLKEERQAVSQALLRSDCFPAQMENWPAMDAEQMEAIKQIIDQSDYYVVISAGKYGSISPETGLSYTEMEYDHAVETGKPIIRLLHRDPFGALKGSQIESKVGVRKKLEVFQAKLMKGNVCCFWENAEQLQKETILALLDIKKRKPMTGWARADGLAGDEALKEIETLKRKIAEAEVEKKDILVDRPNIAAVLSDHDGKIPFVWEDGHTTVFSNRDLRPVEFSFSQSILIEWICEAMLERIDQNDICTFVNGQLKDRFERFSHKHNIRHLAYFPSWPSTTFVQDYLLLLGGHGMILSEPSLRTEYPSQTWHLHHDTRKWIHRRLVARNKA